MMPTSDTTRRRVFAEGDAAERAAAQAVVTQ
jgi:hypothetical protein